MKKRVLCVVYHLQSLVLKGSFNGFLRRIRYYTLLKVIHEIIISFLSQPPGIGRFEPLSGQTKDYEICVASLIITYNKGEEQSHN